MGWLRLSISRVLHRRRIQKCGISEVKHRFALEKLQLLLKIENTTLNQAQSAAGSLQWVSKICPGSRSFLAVLYDFPENKKRFGRNWREIVDYELKSGNYFLKSPRFSAAISSLGDTPQIEIYTDACDWAPFGKGFINWESRIGTGGFPVVNGIVV